MRSPYKHLAVLSFAIIGLFAISKHTFAQSVSLPTPGAPSASITAPGQISVSWTAPTSTQQTIAGYYIYRNGAAIDNTAGLSLIDTVSPGSYVYTVADYDASGDVSEQTAPTAVLSIVGSNGPPTTPTGLTVTSLASTSIALQWTASTDSAGVAGYYLIRNGGQVITTSPITGTSYTDSNLQPDTPYTYEVAAYDASRNVSDYSNRIQIATLPAWFIISQPYNLSATAISTSEIDIAWSPSDDVSSTPVYYIYRDGIPIATTSATSYQDTGLHPGSSYGYSLLPFDTLGNIGLQTGIVGTSTFQPPNAPAVVSENSALTSSTPSSGTTSNNSGSSSTVTPTQATQTQFTTTLYFGMRGNSVKALQLFLIENGDLGPAYATGVFGELTQHAVQQFQCAHAVVCSGSPWTTGWGLVGVKTRKAINAAL